MGIFGALNTAISGLNAQSFAIQNISGNIANSQTPGFKRTDTGFRDLVAEAAPTRQPAGSVLAYSQSTNNVQGDLTGASVDTFMAINGGGYFIIADSLGQTDGRLIFDDSDYYTRRGDFDLDKHGHLVNGAGFYLKGFPVDRDTGNVSGTTAEVLQISNDFLEAKPTQEISYKANLAKEPSTIRSDASVPGSGVFDPATLTGGSTYTAGTSPAAGDAGTAPTGFISRDDTDAFLEQSISGGAITVFDEAGTASNVQIRWMKTETSVDGTGPDVWNAFYLSNSNPANPTDEAWTALPVNYVFGTNSRLDPAVESVTFPAGSSINGVDVEGLTLRHGTNGITQFDDAGGDADVTTLSQDGYGAGALINIAISDVGRVVATYSNGQLVEVAEVAIATFSADNALRKIDGGVFQSTDESGTPILGDAASIVGSSLEASNVDIADEFTKLIITQQAYAASTRVVSTSEEMLQETLAMVR